VNSLSEENIEKFSKYTESILGQFDWHTLPQTDSEKALKDMEVIPAPTGFASVSTPPFTFVGIRSVAKEGIAEQYFLEFGMQIYPLGTRIWHNEALEMKSNA